VQGGPVGRRDRRGLLRRGVKGAVAGPNHAATYDLLCEKQFGLGASFDGEMCACKKGLSLCPCLACVGARGLLCCCASVGARACACTRLSWRCPCHWHCASTAAGSERASA